MQLSIAKSLFPMYAIIFTFYNYSIFTLSIAKY